jgi:hypothetical protein
LVEMPPRAADTKEPVTIVGATAAGAGSSGAGGAHGAPPPVIVTGIGDAGESPIVPRAYTPAAPAAVLTPRRSIARRLSGGMRAIMPSPLGARFCVAKRLSERPVQHAT